MSSDGGGKTDGPGESPEDVPARRVYILLLLLLPLFFFCGIRIVGYTLNTRSGVTSSSWPSSPVYGLDRAGPAVENKAKKQKKKNARARAYIMHVRTTVGEYSYAYGGEVEKCRGSSISSSGIRSSGKKKKKEDGGEKSDDVAKIVTNERVCTGNR